MKKIAVMFYGPPGSGKTTQASLISDKLGLFHFDTGHFLESLVYDPENQTKKVIVRERKLFEEGTLMTPSFVLREVSNETKKIAKAGWGIVFSGSPRTVYEAQNLFPLLEKLYGKKNVFIFVMKINDAKSSHRNTERLVCSTCNRPLLKEFYPSRKPKHCPFCAGSFYKRSLDNAEAIKVRVKQYEERTKPIINLAKKRKYDIQTINGELAPYQIFKKVYAHFKVGL
ncbi:MAG: adenylate kinase [Parcubacteria group bacterium Gr01-1014_20]|nr:MAG: adenylate kinase [Parcubacteria group bacterium Gr01-1014_20]